MIQVVLVGMGMGLAFAMPPGVVTAETVRRGLRGGFGHALAVQVGSLIGDASFALLAFAGLAALLQAPPAQALVGTLGALLMLYLGWQSIRAPARVELAAAAHPSGRRQAFAAGMLLSLTNPMAVAFWVSLGSSLVALGLHVATELPLLFISFLLGTLVWSVALSGLVHRGRRFLTPRLFRGVSILCGVVMLALAAGAAARVFVALSS